MKYQTGCVQGTSALRMERQLHPKAQNSIVAISTKETHPQCKPCSKQLIVGTFVASCIIAFGPFLFL